MNRAIRIRAFKPEDAAHLLEIHRAAILATGEHHYSRQQRESWAFGLTEAGYSDAAAQSDAFLIAVDWRETPQGFSSVSGKAMLALYVHPRAQGQGMGRLLLLASEGVVREGGHAECHVESSLPALKFYQANGYRLLEHGIYTTRGGMELRTATLSKRMT